MKDTKDASGNFSKITPATTQRKSSSPPVIDLEQANTRLAIVAEQVMKFNQETGGRMTYHALSDGTLLIVASLPGHRLGIATIDSGIVPAIDGKAVE